MLVTDANGFQKCVEEVADAIASLASDEASYVTGHGPVLHGGYSIA